MNSSNLSTIIIQTSDNVQKIESDAINISIIEFPKDKNWEKKRNMLSTPFNKPGIYILKSLDLDGKKKIYIGQTKNGFFERIKDPNHYWNKQKNIYSVLYIYSTTSPFSVDDLNFFEANFILSFRKFENQKCEVLNGNNGNEPVYKNDSWTIHHKTNLFQSIIDLIKKLDNNYFNELEEDPKDFKDLIEKDIYLTGKFKDNVSSGIITVYPRNNKQIPFKFNKNNFEVLIPKGTFINTNIFKNIGIDSVVRLIKKLEQDNYIKNNQFIEDAWIKKPSPAAIIIQGSSVDGWDYWVTEDNEPINIFRNVEAIK